MTGGDAIAHIAGETMVLPRISPTEAVGFG